MIYKILIIKNVSMINYKDFKNLQIIQKMKWILTNMNYYFILGWNKQ